MTSAERVKKAIRGEKTDRTPIYGWVNANLSEEISAKFGSVTAFEDKYEFDAAHLFGGPNSLDQAAYDKVRASGEELTPDILLDIPFRPVGNMDDYAGIVDGLRHHSTERQRFCYAQTPGLFEHFNDAFGIEDHLCYLSMYGDEIKELYSRQAKWTKQFASNLLDLGVDMVHISDDWGSQNSLLFSPKMWREFIYPNMKDIASTVKSKEGFLSLHSDGCIESVLDGIADIGFDIIHPFQESAGMSYDLYLEKHSDKFGILGGLCVQTTLGFGDFERLESEIRRVFGLLRGKRWVCCTTHFVQNHCSIEELEFAFDLVYKLARGE